MDTMVKLKVSLICFLLTKITLTLSFPSLSTSLPSSSSSSSSSSSLSSCPNSCYCDQDNLYVSCVGDDQWDFNLPTLPPSVTRLEIKNYNLSTTRSSTFSSSSISSSSSSSLFSNLSSLKLLQELKLTSLSLTFLDNSTFNNLNHLERLDLSNNLLTSLTPGIFSSTSRSSLKYLDLSSNQLSIIDETFIGAISIEHLNLRSNRLTNITINTFLGLIKLTYLNLDCNHISSIELGSFLHLTRLGHLIISNNPISPLTTRFDSLSTKLKYVDVSNISMSTIPHGIDPFIRDLRLSGNHINRLSSGDLDNYLYLNVLVLDYNNLSLIEPDSLGRLEYLIELSVKYNQLFSLPIDLPSSLRKFDLSNNLLPTINSTIFSPLINLERLDLSNNLITTIDPNSFNYSVKLVELNLSGNQLSHLINVQWPPNLKSLHLTLNPIVLTDLISLTTSPFLEELSLINIKSSPAINTSPLIVTKNCSIVKLDHLTKIYLINSSTLSEQILNCNCESTAIDLRMPNLLQLNLLGTKLKQFGSNFPDKMRSLKVLSSDSSKLDCSLIDNQKVSLWLQSNNINSKLTIKPSSETMKCHLPTSIHGLPLIKLPDYLSNRSISDIDKIQSINNNQLALNLSSKYETNIEQNLIKTRSKQFTNDDETSTILPEGMTPMNLSSPLLSSSSSSSSKRNHSKDYYASRDLHLPGNNNINNRNDQHLIIINGNISIKQNKPMIQSSLQSESSSGHSEDQASHQHLPNDNSSLLIHSNLSDKADSEMASRGGKFSSHDNEYLNDNSSLLSSSSPSSLINDTDKLSNLTHNFADNLPISIENHLVDVNRSSDTLKRSIVTSVRSSFSSVPSTSSSSGLLILTSSFASSQPLQAHSLSSQSTAATSPSSSTSYLFSYGIVSVVIGSLIISMMICFAVVTMIKSRKVYSSISKDNRVDNRSWLHRSVSYLSQNDEVSFLSLNDTIDLNGSLPTATPTELGGNRGIGLTGQSYCY